MTDKVLEHYFNSKLQKAPLEMLVDCFKGRNVTGGTAGEVAIVNLSDMDQTGIAYDQLKRLPAEDSLTKHYLQTGDVLVATKGTVKKAVVFEEQAYPVIASANISVLRIKQDLRPYYLKLFLDSPAGHHLLDLADNGKAVMNISRQSLLSIEIPMLPLVKQDYLSQAYLQGLRDYQRKVNRAQQEWDNTYQNIEKNLFG